MCANALECSVYIWQVVKSSDNDQVTIVGAGVTLHEALKAAEELENAGVRVRVVDPFTIKPIDKEGLISAVKATGGRLIVVEDHYREGMYATDTICIMYALMSGNNK